MHPNLEVLLDCDRDNPQESLRALRDVFPESEAAIDACAESLFALPLALGEQSSWDEQHEAMEQWASKLGLRGPEALALLRDAIPIGSPPPGDTTSCARQHMHDATALLARVHLAVRIQRDFLFGVTDLLRLRLTSCIGYWRPQSECFGQLVLLTKEQTFGGEWFASMTQGRAFHEKWHGRVVPAIRDLGLYDWYSQASNFAMHARSSGTALGTLLGHKQAPRPGVVQLVFQETNDPRILFLLFGQTLAFYRVALRSANVLYPELVAALPLPAMRRFFELQARVGLRARAVHDALVKEGMAHALAGPLDG